MNIYLLLLLFYWQALSIVWFFPPMTVAVTNIHIT